MGFGSGHSRGNDYKGVPSQSSPAQKAKVGGYRDTDSLKMANSLVKGLNVMSFNYSAFAYQFVQRAPNGVLTNFFKAFEAVANVLSERIDSDSYSGHEEYELGIIAKRIEDSLSKYE